MRKKKSTSPVLLKGMSLGEMLNSIQNNKPEPMTPEKQARIDDLLKQLRDSQGPGDSFMVLSIKSKK